MTGDVADLIEAGARVGFKGGYATVIAVAGGKAWVRWDHLPDYAADAIFPDIERLYVIRPGDREFEPAERPE